MPEKSPSEKKAMGNSSSRACGAKKRLAL